MASFSDYAELTKYETCKSDDLKKAIFKASRKLGSGVLSPVPYDTAWVARVPEKDQSTPAYPQSLQWLRDHQNEDGSWGADYPHALHSEILNTFAAVLALAEWNLKQDEDRIENGIQALELLARSLPREQTEENTFEIILASLLDDARTFELELAYEKFEWHAGIGKTKLKSLEKEIMSNKPNKYWSLLEAAGSMDLVLKSYRSEITRYGLIAAQPSTTAFLLRYARLQGYDYPEAAWIFEEVCARHRGGVPHLISVDNFELIHGLDILFKVNVNPRLNYKYAYIQKALKTLENRIDSQRGIGFSSDWPVFDGECSEIALSIVQQAPEENSETECIKTNKQMSYSCEEPHFEDRTWLRGIRNISLYYNLLQSVYAVSKQDIKTIMLIEYFIGEKQNSDGGWGAKYQSSAEETAYVCLAIFRLIQTGKRILHRIDFPKLVSFMNNVETRPHDESFWCYKVLCCSTTLTEVVLAASKYAIFQIQRLCMFTDVLSELQIDFFDIEIWNETSEQVQKNVLPMVRFDLKKEDFEVDKTEVLDICKTILQTDQLDRYMLEAVKAAVHGSCFFFNRKLQSHDIADTVIFFFITHFSDDMTDNSDRGDVPIPAVLETLKSALEIFRGEHRTFDSLPSFHLPRLELFWRSCFHCRELEEKQPCNRSLTKALERWSFRGQYLSCLLEYYDIIPAPREYLECSKLDIFSMDTAYLVSFKEDTTFDSTGFDNDKLFVKYCDCASKTSRLISDVASVYKDLHLNRWDNYCILLTKEFGISLNEAVTRTAKKANKEFMKMYALKKIILQGERVKNEKLKALVENIERVITRGVTWVLQTPRYNIGKKSATKIDHRKGDLKFTWELCFEHN